MTVNTDISTAAYTGNGSTAIFSVPFYFLADADLKVSKLTAAGVGSVLVLNSDYTVTGAGVEVGGSITTIPALPTGDKIFIERNVDAVQQTEYPVNGAFPAASHERALDRLTMLAQQVIAKLTFGLFRDPLANTYDAGGNTISNVANAVNAQDVPSLAQTQALVTGATTGIIPSLIALLSDLISTAAGKGAALIGFLGGGTGAVARTVQDKLRDTVNVLDYGAVGDGVTDDGPAFQLAINALPNGGVVKVPQRNYAWATKVVANAGVLLQGDTVYDNTNNTNGSAAAVPRIFWNGATLTGTNDVMFWIKPATVGNTIFGGGTRGIAWSGQAKINYCVRFDNCRNARFEGRIDQPLLAGLDICSQSGSASVFAEHNIVERLDFLWGASVPCRPANGLLIRGNGSTAPGTQHFIGPCTGLVYDGFMVQLQESDNCQFEFIAGTRQSGGAGGTLKVLNVGAQPACNNTFKWLGGYTTWDNGLFGNHILHYSAEGGTIAQLAGTSSWLGSLIDYTTGKEHRSHFYQLRKKIGIPAGAMLPDGVSTILQLASQWVGAKMPESATSTLTATLPPDYDIESGSITGVELRYSTNGTSAGNLRIKVDMSSLADGNVLAVVTPEASQTYTIAAATQYKLTVATLTLTTPLTVAAGDNLLFKVTRLPADALDTSTDDCIVLSARLLFVGDGPNTGGSGPWVIPTW